MNKISNINQIVNQTKYTLGHTRIFGKACPVCGKLSRRIGYVESSAGQTGVYYCAECKKSFKCLIN